MSPFKGSTYAPALATIHAQCFAAPWTVDNFHKILALPTTFGFGNSDGFILCADLGDALEILTLAVLPTHRRQGLATTLLNCVQDYAKTYNKDRIFLEVNSTNTPAISLYSKNGFTQTNIRKDYYHEKGKTFDALCLTWEKP